MGGKTGGGVVPGPETFTVSSRFRLNDGTIVGANYHRPGIDGAKQLDTIPSYTGTLDQNPKPRPEMGFVESDIASAAAYVANPPLIGDERAEAVLTRIATQASEPEIAQTLAAVDNKIKALAAGELPKGSDAALPLAGFGGNLGKIERKLKSLDEFRLPKADLRQAVEAIESIREALASSGLATSMSQAMERGSIAPKGRT